MRRGSIFANLDWFTVILFLVMIILGWLNIFSAVYAEDHPSILDMNQRYGKQFLWICAAIFTAAVILFIDSRFYEFFGYFIYGFAILLLIGVLLIGKEINGAKSWIVLGGFQIQPSEFAKPAAALALAKYLSGHNIDVRKIKTLFVSGIFIFTPSLLILLQPDTGSALVYFAFILPLYREGFSVNILLAMLALVVIFLLVLLLDLFIVLGIIIAAGFIAYGIMTRSIKNTGIALLVFVISGVLVYGIRSATSLNIGNYLLLVITAGISALIYGISLLANRLSKSLIVLSIIVIASIYSYSVDYAFHHLLSDYQQRRVNILLGFESDLQGAGYNVNQSKIAIGSGGFSGKGFLQGTQTKLHFVPEQSTDFIFCTVGEEWGFLGSVMVVLLFVALLLRLLQLAERQRHRFSRIFGYSILSVFFIHFFVNIAMTIGLFPVIGIPLPFFSYGGSSLWAFTIMLFIFLRLDAGRMEYLR
ncbi:MAG: rod shape-determining protein RodA [Bacteroidales bacterium]